ncbi:MAG TPA: CRISPR-associated endoribonuclease Cas6, partial [Thermomicrobiales bacterium]|nr:CRISPR-associated endoribonuclease Cas6 [Thermomicrobiales bacterium]
PPRGPIATYEELWAAARPANELTLRFLSPTAFRHKGLDILQPEPRLAFGRLLRRWETFAPTVALPLDETSLAARVHLMDARLTVRPVELGARRQPGFVGWARYRLDGDAAFQTAVAALADYAAYAGVGARTALGMGHARRDCRR